jgi:hypothetical protein
MDGFKMYNFSTTVQLSWSGGSVTPYVPYISVQLDLSAYSEIYSITPRSKSGANNDRCLPCVIGGYASNRKYLIGAYGNSNYVNAYSDITVTLDIIAR